MFKVIVATDCEYGIGDSSTNKLKWHIQEDMKFFKQITTSTRSPNKKNCVIMGRKTYESIPPQYRPLAGRKNYVLTKNKNFKDEEICVRHNIDELIIEVSNDKLLESAFIIGGAEIYKEFLNRGIVGECYHTFIDHDYNCNVKLFINSHFVFYPKNGLSINCDYKILNEIHIENSINKNDDSIQVTFFHYQKFNKEENNYLELMRKILEEGKLREDRTLVGTLSLFGCHLTYDISKSLPILTTKFVPFRIIVEELLWMLSGSTDATILQKKGIHIWDHNTSREFLDSRGLNHLPEGDLGAGYGFQLRHYGAEYKTCKDDYTGQGFDQLAEVVRLLKEEPHSRRIQFTYWSPSMIYTAALPACHNTYQFYVQDGNLSCMMTQRSSDYFLANNYNAVAAALITYMLAKVCGYKPLHLIHNLGDTHIYLNHIEQSKEQLLRKPQIQPKLILEDKFDIDSFVYEDFKLIGYRPQAAIKGEIN